MRGRIYITLLLIFIPSILLAQRVRSVTATYRYVMSANESMESAKVTAIEKAKLEALTNEFGTQISQSNAMIIDNSNEKSSSHFLSIGGSDVNGEWLEDSESPVIRIETDGVTLVVVATVFGKAREIKKVSIDLTARLLRNGCEQKNESDSFVSGDDFYLLFQSPVDGYLAVYLADKSNQAYCLLPYQSDRNMIYNVTGGVQYIFFSEEYATNPKIVDEYQLVTDEDGEYNRIYVIFSPNEFYKVNDSSVDGSMPRVATFSSFNKWLVNARVKDDKMQVLNKIVYIKGE